MNRSMLMNRVPVVRRQKQFQRRRRSLSLLLGPRRSVPSRHQRVRFHGDISYWWSTNSLCSNVHFTVHTVCLHPFLGRQLVFG